MASCSTRSGWKRPAWTRCVPLDFPQRDSARVGLAGQLQSGWRRCCPMGQLYDHVALLALAAGHPNLGLSVGSTNGIRTGPRRCIGWRLPCRASGVHLPWSALGTAISKHVPFGYKRREGLAASRTTSGSTNCSGNCRAVSPLEGNIGRHQRLLVPARTHRPRCGSRAKEKALDNRRPLTDGWLNDGVPALTPGPTCRTTPSLCQEFVAMSVTSGRYPDQFLPSW